MRFQKIINLTFILLHGLRFNYDFLILQNLILLLKSQDLICYFIN